MYMTKQKIEKFELWKNLEYSIQIVIEINLSCKRFEFELHELIKIFDVANIYNDPYIFIYYYNVFLYL